MVVARQSGGARRTLAANLNRLRRQRGLSQEACAFECGLHRTYFGALERAERNVSLDILERVAFALGVEAWELLRGVE